MKQLELDVDDGHHVGPLWVPVKRRSPIFRNSTSHGKRRRAKEKRATPPWARSGEIWQQIRAIYKQAKYLTATTGEQHDVDHIVPLDGKIVCGLNVPWNMQVLHWLPNARKGWYTWPGMPMEQLELIE